MFAVGDLVQPRAGGPKLKVVKCKGSNWWWFRPHRSRESAIR